MATKKVAIITDKKEAAETNPETITLSTGVVLRLMRPSRFLMQEKLKQMMPKQPKPPIVHIADKDMDEENPADPAYLEAQTRFLSDWNAASENATIFMGTAVESLPDGFSGPDDELWQQEVADAYGLDVPKGKLLRYCLWVKVWAVRTDDDAMKLKAATDTLLGIPQRKVDEAAQSFRGGEERDADMGTPDPA